MFQSLKKINWDWVPLVLVLAFVFLAAYDFAKLSRENLKMHIEDEIQLQIKMHVINAIAAEIKAQEQNASRDGN